MKLEANELSFRYQKGSRQILNHFSMTLESGERLGFAAPSGWEDDALQDPGRV